MPSSLRQPWLIVTAEAWPFVSEVAFERGVTAIGEVSPGILDDTTQALAEDLERWVGPRAHGLSLDAIRQFRDRAWFAGMLTWPRSRPLEAHLRELATQYLCWTGGRVCVRTTCDGDVAARARRFRWLSLLLPGDLMGAAVAQGERGQLHDTEIDVGTPHLSDVLNRPVAATHYHVGAALRFGELWAGLMRSIARRSPSLRPRMGRPPFAERFEHRLLEAAINRWLMATYLRTSELRSGEALGYAEWVESWLPHWARRTGGPNHQRFLWAATFGAVRFFLTGRGRWLPTASLRLAYQRITGPARREPRSIQDMIEQDPLHGWTQRPGASAEATLALAAFEYLAAARRQGRPDPAFQRAFWQYQRVRCATFRYLTQEPGTGGLDWFQTYYDRIGALRGPLDRLSFSSALRIDGRSASLAATEPRTTPDVNWYAVRDYVRLIARQALDHPPTPGRDRPEVGLIYHFLKSRERNDAGRRTMHANPAIPPQYCRFGSLYEDGLARARAMESALARNPELLTILRGLDVASTELAAPFWPFLPLIQRVRVASRRTAQVLAVRLPRYAVPALRVTLHAGEDFRRLSEGLRRMHEPIEFGGMQAGDRFGHGLALGTEPRGWARSCRLVAQPREERLDDLLWELARYGLGDLPAHAGRIEPIRTEAAELAREIYQEDYSIDTLLRARCLRHSAAALNFFGYPRCRDPARTQSPALDCLSQYLRDPGTFQRGQVPVEVYCSAAEVQMLEDAQRWLRRELGRLELTIEANPSSNLVIGDLLDLEEHPIFRLMPLSPKADEVSLPVSINVDNPITFASCIADEFAHTYHALLHAGVSSDTALTWLERARQAGLRSRFTLACSRDAEVLERVSNAWRAGGRPMPPR